MSKFSFWEIYSLKTISAGTTTCTVCMYQIMFHFGSLATFTQWVNWFVPHYLYEEYEHQIITTDLGLFLCLNNKDYLEAMHSSALIW